MTEQVHIPVEVLRRASQLLLDHLESTEGETVSLDKDYYWAIDPDQVHDVYNEPSKLTVGQLTECLENLEGIIGDPSRSTSYGLVWLADLMRAVGHAVVQ